MPFRWIAVLTLWTCLSGPIFSGPSASPSKDAAPAKAPHAWHSSAEARR